MIAATGSIRSVVLIDSRHSASTMSEAAAPQQGRSPARASATVGSTQQRPGATKQNGKGDQLSVTHQRSPRQGVTRTVIQLVRVFFAGVASAPAAGAGVPRLS
jgi:hypothetical protein